MAVNWPLEHARITHYQFEDAPSFASCDVVAVDPQHISSIWQTAISPGHDGSIKTYTERDRGFGQKLLKLISSRQLEVHDLLNKVGGIIICKLVPPGKSIEVWSVRGIIERIDRYSWLPREILGSLSSIVRKGDDIAWIDHKHPLSRYFKAFSEERYYTSVIDQARIPENWNIVAKNRAGDVVCLEIHCGVGRFIFLSTFRISDYRKEAGVLLNCLKDLLKIPIEESAPAWSEKYQLPGRDRHEARIRELND